MIWFFAAVVLCLAVYNAKFRWWGVSLLVVMAFLAAANSG
jgi:hypothetical protein